MKKEVKKTVYVICSRCELNYIDKKDKYCNVCKAEMGLLDSAILIPEDEEELGLEKLCPQCKVNYIGEDEEICFLCQKEKGEKETYDNSEETWLIEEEDTIADDLDMGLKLEDSEEDEEDEEFDEEFSSSDEIYYDDIDFDEEDDSDDESYDDEDFDEDDEI